MATYKTEGIILKRINLGEADKILTVFSKHYGKITCLAKGVRRLKSRKGGSVELFNRTKLVLARGKSLDIITEVDLVDIFSDWRKNLVRVGVAYYFAEVVDRLTPERQKNERVFATLNNFLVRLGKADLKRLVREFEEEILVELGFGVPARLVGGKSSLSEYIEEIIERKIKSKEVLIKIKYAS